ncbi:MAG: N-methyl-L-tryptophan oxidase [Sulfobacillus sp.]
MDEVGVVGLGVIGAAISWRLGEGGQPVVGYDRFRAGHPFGSSHGAARIIRQAYYEHPDYVPLVQRSWTKWQELERVSGRSLLRQTGGLMIGPPDGELVSGTLESVRRHGLRHAVLDAAAIGQRFPQFRVPAGEIGIFEDLAGVLRCEMAVETLIRAAGRARQPLSIVHDQVLHLEAVGERVRVHTASGRRDFAQVVVAAGGWTSDLLPDLNLPLTVERQVQVWFAPPAPASFTPPQFPIWMHQTEDGQMFYGLPAMDGKSVKAARHHQGITTSMEHLDRHVSDQDRAVVKCAVAQILPGLGSEIAQSSVCSYTDTPDLHFLIGRLQALPGVILATGFSGHGFKFAPVIGDLIADIVLRDALPPALLATTRFSL